MEYKLRREIEKLDWFITKDDDGWYLSKFSPLGEDFGFYTSDIALVDGICDYAEMFDPDEHAEILIAHRGTQGIPDSIRDLVQDADDIKASLLELAKAVTTYVENKSKSGTKSSK